MSRSKGNLAEDKASEYLLSLGFSIVERNFYTRFGEVDIIASKEDVLHFIEVKSALEYESAVQNITPSKIKKLLKTVDVYLKKNALQGDYTLDAVIVTPREIEFLENITL